MPEVIVATILAGDAVDYQGRRVEGHAPCMRLARALHAAGDHDPNAELHFYRGDALALVMRPLRLVGLRTVEEEGGGDGTPRLAKWKPWGVAGVRDAAGAASDSSEPSE